MKPVSLTVRNLGVRGARSATVAALLALALAGCHKDPPQPVGDEPGLAEPGAASKLSFAITAIHEKQRPAVAAPWHEPGGDWTFFDAASRDGVRFGFGFESGATSGGPVAFGKGMLTTPDRASAQALIDAFAKAFGGKAPPAPATPRPLAVTPFALVILGTDAARTANGFEGQGGGYHATKLFLQRNGIEAEVFFNFNLAKKTADFAEKDPDYANDLLAFLALELRDGPPP
jgi:hypothetical protein